MEKLQYPFIQNWKPDFQYVFKNSKRMTEALMWNIQDTEFQLDYYFWRKYKLHLDRTLYDNNKFKNSSRL